MKRLWWLKLGVPLLLLIGFGLTVPLQGGRSNTLGDETAQERVRPKMLWNHVSTNMSRLEVLRTKVPGGWFVHVCDNGRDSSAAGALFYPDPKHEWDGSSQPR